MFFRRKPSQGNIHASCPRCGTFGFEPFEILAIEDKSGVASGYMFTCPKEKTIVDKHVVGKTVIHELRLRGTVVLEFDSSSLTIDAQNHREIENSYGRIGLDEVLDFYRDLGSICDIDSAAYRTLMQTKSVE